MKSYKIREKKTYAMQKISKGNCKAHSFCENLETELYLCPIESERFKYVFHLNVPKASSCLNNMGNIQYLCGISEMCRVI